MDLRDGLPEQLQESGQPIPVLCWHDVSPGLFPGLTRVSPRRFKEQIQTLKDAGRQGISLSQWLERRGLADSDEKLCLLCFDDGYEGVLHHAFPILQEADFTAAIFPVLNYIGKEARWDPAGFLSSLKHMDTAGLKKLQAAGWEIGLHGSRHLPLNAQPLHVLDAEIVTARTTLELDFDCIVHVISWPYGLSDRRSRNLASAAGLRMGLGRFDSTGPLDMSRQMVYPTHGPEAIQKMLDGASPDLLQRLAAAGAGFSAELGRLFFRASRRDSVAYNE